MSVSEENVQDILNFVIAQAVQDYEVMDQSEQLEADPTTFAAENHANEQGHGNGANLEEKLQDTNNNTSLVNGATPLPPNVDLLDVVLEDGSPTEELISQARQAIQTWPRDAQAFLCYDLLELLGLDIFKALEPHVPEIKELLEIFEISYPNEAQKE